MLKGVVVGFVLAVIILVGGVYYYFAAGMAPVAIADPLMPFERKLAHMSLEAHLQKQTTSQPAVAADEANYLAGAEVYKQHCAVCHGLPGVPQSAIASGMFPKPPKLMEGTGVTDDPAGETYWKVAGGIRMTGMPGFEKTLSTTQMWQVSLLCANADKLSAPVKQILAAVPPIPAAAE